MHVAATRAVEHFIIAGYKIGRELRILWDSCYIVGTSVGDNNGRRSHTRP